MAWSCLGVPLLGLSGLVLSALVLSALVLSALVLSACSVSRDGMGPPSEDAGRDTGAGGDAAVCVSEVCNGEDDDCDGDVDEDFNLNRDPLNCGSCGMRCPDRHSSSPSCAAGECTITCDPGFADCDTNLANGCEASLADNDTCGSCATPCTDPSPLCEGTTTGEVRSYTCVVSCGSGSTRCDDSCVDTDTDVTNCGDCGTVCAAPDNAYATCVAGTCGFECNSGFGACDVNPANGCEQALNAVDHCGVCDNLCTYAHADATCTGDPRMCEMGPCNLGWADCNGDGLGCETGLGSNAHCGGCNEACNAEQTCQSGACVCTGDCSCADTPACHCGPGQMCNLDCADACAGTCDGAVCDAGPGPFDDLDLTCEAGASCTISARDSDNVDVTCDGPGTMCFVDCDSATTCDVSCTNGAICVLDCDDAGTCGIGSCSTSVTDCPDSVESCGAPCLGMVGV